MNQPRAFKDNIRDRARRSASFRRALLAEAIEAMLQGEPDVGKSIIRDYINATVGFEALARGTRKPLKSLMQMFGPRGNPTAENLFSVLAWLQDQEGIHLTVRAHRN